MGLSREIAYLPDVERLGDLRELLDRNVCWVGALDDADARNLIARAVSHEPTASETAEMLRLSGNFPAILKLVALWWMRHPTPPPIPRWQALLQAENNIEHRLAKLWDALTQEEQFALFEVRNATAATPALTRRHGPTLEHLQRKGVCIYERETWRVRGALWADYVQARGATSRGRIWQHPETREIYQGEAAIPDLTPLERRLLSYLIAHPRRPHESEALIAHIWEEKAYHMADNDLHQLVYRLRKKVDADPPQYIVTWKGRPGGYQFYPEGQPQPD